jgi:hypothetical protein
MTLAGSNPWNCDSTTALEFVRETPEAKVFRITLVWKCPSLLGASLIPTPMIWRNHNPTVKKVTFLKNKYKIYSASPQRINGNDL